MRIDSNELFFDEIFNGASMKKPCRWTVVANVALVGCLLNPFIAQSDDVRKRSDGDARAVFAATSRSVVVVEALNEMGRSQGSGVVYRIGLATDNANPRHSWIVTNAHVVTNSASVFVVQNGKRYAAIVDSLDVEWDLAMLHVEGAALSPINVDEAAHVTVGQRVYAIGSPLGLENSISEGIVSGRRVRDGLALWQITAPISPGSSGGGLFDSSSRLIGITTFKASGGENINFAIDVLHVSQLARAGGEAGDIRIIADHMGITPQVKEAIASHRFTQWLLHALAVDGQPMLIEVERIMHQDTSGTATESFDRMVDGVRKIVQQYVGAQPGVEHTQSSIQGQTVILNCPLVDRVGHDPETRIDRTFKVNYANNTVNDFPVTISDSMISWLSGDKKTSTQINRYTGSIVVNGTNSGHTLFLGKCTAVTEKQF